MANVTLKSLAKSEQELKSLTAWVEFEGLRFKIRYLSRMAMRELAQRCLIQKYDRNTGRRNPTLDYAKLAEQLGAVIVADWDRISLRSLARHLPLNLESQPASALDAPIPYVLGDAATQENLTMMLENINGLDSYLQEAACDISVFQRLPEEAEEAETKNSPSSPAGAPTPIS